MSVVLTADGFEKFLSLLASDREAAGEKYEVVRLKLTKYFELRMCADPDALADETIDRVSRRLAEGERVLAEEPMRYLYGVARNVYLEYQKSERRHDRVGVEVRSVAETERSNAELQLDCFQSCLGEQTDESRSLLIQYYRHSGRTKIDERAELARRMSIPVNALRIRIHRIKAAIQRCMETCLQKRLQ